MSVLHWIYILTALLALLVKVHGVTLCSSPCLLVSNTTDIVTMDIQTSAVNSVVVGLTRAVAIDVHFSLGYIFWSDVTERSIKRLHIHTNTTTTIISNIGVCDGLAVHWRNSKLFWSDTTTNTISVSDLDGNNQLAIISFGLDEPRGIALDPDNNFMFWTDLGLYPKIERATLSGNQRTSIVTKNLYHPNGLDLDKGNQRIFWVDAGLDRVESIDYNGGNRKLLFQQSGLHPFGITLVPPFLFFTDWHASREVHKLDALTGEVFRSYNINGGQPMGIVAYDGFRQPSASSPCSVNNGGCSHFCVPKPSGHECKCPTGLAVRQNGRTCEEKVKKFLLYTDADDKSTNIISLDVNYMVSKTLFKHLGDHRPIALDFDPVENRVYWTDVRQGRIMSAFRNASSAKTLYYCNVLNPDGLAIDHVGRNIYWTDTGTDRIELGRLDGSKRKVLFKDGLDEPRAIVLDGRNGMMYWTDWGAHPKIEKAEMDGSGRQSIVTGNLAWPNGLSIDQATNRLYWVDARLDTIEMTDLNGGNRQLLLSSADQIHPFGLALYENVLYWTDWNKKSILRYNLTSAKHETVIPDLQKPMDIHVYDPSLSFSGPHACTQNNGFCSDFCLLKPGGYKCACPTGISLKPDGRSCDDVQDTFDNANSKKFMIFAEANTQEIYSVAISVSENPCKPLQIKANISSPLAVDYDPFEGRIYWTDAALKIVARAFPNGSSVEVVAYNNVQGPEGLAVDYIQRNLYWTDAGTRKIEVARLDGSSRRGLITSSIESPNAIILNIAERKMFWSDQGLFPKIEQANMDGSARAVLVNSGLVGVNSLAIDYSGKLLYWCDANLDKIERVDFQGNNRVVILDLSSDTRHPFGLALSDDVLYWSDLEKKNINKYNMTSSRSEVLVHGMGSPKELHIHDDGKTFSGSTSCSHLNGGCSHLCLPNPSGHQCFCPEGILLKPGDPLTCQGVTRCAILSVPTNGTLKPCSNLPGNTCQFSCDKGYILSGSATRTCRNDGTWTGTHTQCNAATCPALPTPANGIQTGCTGKTAEQHNTVCQFSCKSGFTAIGSPTRKCQENGTWSGQDFVCVAKVCPQLNIPTKAVLLTPSCGNTHGSNCVLGCQVGYGNVDGNVTRTCLNTGKWSGKVINCTDVFPPTFGVTCPKSPLSLYAERGQFSSLVTWTTPVATDNSADPPMITSNYQPPHRFNEGIHVILYNAVDQSGNKATCTFTIKITVINCTKLVVSPGDPLHMSSCGNHYGAQCNFSCPTGYRLNGSSSLTCVAQSDSPPGFWDKNLPKCHAITCPALPIPKHGQKVGCHDPISEPYNAQCWFSCQASYNLIGSSVRRCLMNGTWSGVVPSCRGISCDPLVPHKNMVISPSSCLSSSSHGQICRFSCRNPGYILDGAPSKVCDKNGKWTGSNDTRCRDIQHPRLQCPLDIVVPTDTDQSYANVTWEVPVPTDNSREHLILTGLTPPQQFNVGTNHITYKVTDSSALSSSCTFSIQVKDKEPPRISSCPENILITTAKRWTKVWLPGVRVTDNVGVHIFITSSPNGSEFTWGQHNITYSAIDTAGNTAMCKFRITIKDHECPKLHSPLNGAKACDLWLDSGKICTLHCNAGYDFANKPPEFYFCGALGRGWLPHDKIPDCSATRQPKTLLKIQLHYLADQCNEGLHGQIASNFIALYTTYLRTDKGCDSLELCTIENVEVECRDQTGTLRKRDLESDQLSSRIPLSVTFDLELPLPRNTSVVDLNQTTEEISNDLLVNFNRTDVNLNVSGISIMFDASKPPQVRFVRLLCDSGQVLRGSKCVSCPVGYFHNTSGCQACAVDHYQDKEAQTSCVPCPSGTSTSGALASKWRENCTENLKTSDRYEKDRSGPPLSAIIAIAIAVPVIVIVGVGIFFVRKQRIAKARGTAGAKGHANPVYEDPTSNNRTYDEIEELQFPSPYSHYQSLNTNHIYAALRNSHSEA